MWKALFPLRCVDRQGCEGVNDSIQPRWEQARSLGHNQGKGVRVRHWEVPRASPSPLPGEGERERGREGEGRERGGRGRSCRRRRRRVCASPQTFSSFPAAHKEARRRRASKGKKRRAVGMERSRGFLQDQENVACFSCPSLPPISLSLSLPLLSTSSSPLRYSKSFAIIPSPPYLPSPSPCQPQPLRSDQSKSYLAFTPLDTHTRTGV
ncbi:hypothetical protein IE53DRAFT_249831 [Violaceomyces palustris]|uniref:Uncharacterized protein n=1 Tax=Violaceomyces palustris TaxID=1673888 RepID=A0ACD0NNR2_9BASI|nr:hypothetical protein IE53DRAFT_249831 [Violaceomyces palustris]